MKRLIVVATFGSVLLGGVTSCAAHDYDCDVAVLGGGSGGFGAALAAARLGLDVVLVERADCLGGNSVRGGVACWEMGIGGTGIPFDLYRRLKQQPQAIGIYSYGRHASTFDPTREAYRYPGGETVIDPTRRYLDTLMRHGARGLSTADARAFRRERWHGLPFEPDAMAKTMLAMLKETGRCRVLFNTAFVSAQVTAGTVHSVKLSDGRKLNADYYVDATGDGVVCVATGCETMMGQEPQARFGEPHAPTNATARVNGVTLIYRVTPAAEAIVEPLPDGVPEKCWWAGRFPSAQINHCPNGDLNVNMLPTMDGKEFLQRGYDNAMTECQRRIRAHWHHVQTACAEFQKFRLKWIAPALGIR
ncbi:MAG: FAD-dependent oxidoreductase, partial [Verrucomicrobia bacterium]|nr:FAD-dependent oxidoreductase [Verrucomicrobiota bacterium]